MDIYDEMAVRAIIILAFIYMIFGSQKTVKVTAFVVLCIIAVLQLGIATGWIPQHH